MRLWGSVKTYSDMQFELRHCVNTSNVEDSCVGSDVHTVDGSNIEEIFFKDIPEELFTRMNDKTHKG